jgi:Ca-activated chloride channel family protein
MRLMFPRESCLGPMVKLLRMGPLFLLVGLISIQVFSRGEPAKHEQPENTDFTFAVNVGLVVLPVTVLDKSGRRVPGLTEKNFAVYEDGIQQQIQVFDPKDMPVAVGLLIDNSSSMAPKRAEVAAAALELAESSNPEDQIFVIHFYDHIAFTLRVGEAFTSDLDELRAAVTAISGSGRTALYDALIAGLEHVQMSELPKRALVIVSDGGDNASSHTLKEAMDMAAASNALIYSIGIYDEYDREQNPKVLKRLANITGGDAFFPTNVSQLSDICRHIAADIRSQYTLGYVPGSPNRDGGYRSIRVSVHAPDLGRLTIRTRSGYLAPAERKARKAKG